jgi:FkbM family methyltransferase
MSSFVKWYSSFLDFFTMSLLNALSFIVKHPLNKKRKIQALIDFIKWQIGSRIVPGEIIYTWVNNVKIIVRPGETGLTQNIYCGLHEFSDMAYLLHLLTEDDLFVDIGANVGSYTILASAVKRARTYCFEPVPSTFLRLMNNIYINNLSELVTCFNIGISDSEDKLVFTDDQNCINHVVSSNENCDAVVQIEVLPLDTVLEDQTPLLIKIDVEGFETPVINGAKGILNSPHLCSVIMELNGSGDRYGYDESLIMQTMKEHGFTPYQYDPFSRILVSLEGKNTQSGNTLFIRNMDFVLDRLKRASKISVKGFEI